MSTTRPIPAGSTVTPTLTGIPSETLLDILLLLPYDDLRHLRHVCRAFHSLFEHPALMRATFREAPHSVARPIPTHCSGRIVVHPVLANRIHWLGSGLSRKTIVSLEPQTIEEPLPLLAVQGRNEWATQPAATCVQIQVRSHHGSWPFSSRFIANDPAGIRLGQLIDLVAQTLVPRAVQVSRHASCGIWMGPSAKQPKFAVTRFDSGEAGLTIVLEMVAPWFVTFDTVCPATSSTSVTVPANTASPNGQAQELAAGAQPFWHCVCDRVSTLVSDSISSSISTDMPRLTPPFCPRAALGRCRQGSDAGPVPQLVLRLPRPCCEIRIRPASPAQISACS
jgi:hypothetical protein